VLKNITLLITSIVVSLFLGEAMVRTTLDKNDFLTPLLRTHPQFNTMIAPNSSGHDKWGFRNDSVPQKPDLLTIGDSFTYGYLASKENTWPRIVARQTGLSVYNVSMGGWGPSQYLCAMKVYGRTLKPKFAVVAVYLGNDIGQAATEDYPCDERDPDRISAGSKSYPVTNDGALRRLRTWLSHHSALYQLIKTRLKTQPWFEKVSDPRYQNIFVDSSTGSAVALRIEPQDSAPGSKCDVGPGVAGHRFDWAGCDAQFHNGVAIAIERLTDMKRECERIGAICITILIPSKESLYYPLLSNSLPPNIAGEQEHLWRNEQSAGKAIAAAFADTDMVIVNSERLLQNTIRAGTKIFPVNDWLAAPRDPHFDSRGYEVIGSLVSAELKALHLGNPVAAAR
jgi:hypothetical protein